MVNTAFGTLCLVALAAVLLHVAYLLVNGVLVLVLRVPDREAAAVLIMGSEKTLPMAITVIAYLPEALGSTGQLTVPCVIAHISQVLIDAALVGRIASRIDAREAHRKQVLPQTAQDAAPSEMSQSAVSEEVSGAAAGVKEGVEEGAGAAGEALPTGVDQR